MQPELTNRPNSSDHAPAGGFEPVLPPHPVEAQPAGRRHRHRSPLRRLQKRLGKAVKWQLVVVAVLVILVVPGAVAAAFVTDANARVQDSYASLRRVLTTLQGRSLNELSQIDVSRLQSSISNLTADLRYARQQTTFLRPFAGLRADVKNQLQTLDIAYEMAQAAQATLTGLQPTFLLLLPTDTQSTTSSTWQLGSLERVVELLHDGQTNFSAAAQHLADAQKQLDALDTASLSPDLFLTIQDIKRYEQQFTDFNQLLANSPDVLTAAFGLDTARNYLILSANNDEIRPSGGYISTFGWVRVHRSQITDFGYAPTSATSPNPPPETMVSQLSIPTWWIQYPHPIYTAWDGSWYADFPSTAKLAAWFYDNGQNPRSPVDGVIGIDITGFQEMLSAIGTVTVPGYDDTVTADNFRQVIYRIRDTGTGDAPHKVFLAALYKQILADWQTLSQTHADKLLGALLTALEQKHLMLYFKDNKLNQVVNALGWSGAQTAAVDHDYIMVADTNLGNKSNSSITRHLTYDVQIQNDGSLKSRLTINYDYLAAVAANDPAVNPRNYTDINYYNTMQVFVPAKATLTDTKDLQEPVTTVAADTQTNFITLTEVKYDNSGRYQFSYTTPPVVQSAGTYHHYQLLLQKQPGMVGEKVDVTVTLPAGASVVSVSPDVVANYNLGQPVDVFRLTLTTDRWIDLIYRN